MFPSPLESVTFRLYRLTVSAVDTAAISVSAPVGAKYPSFVPTDTLAAVSIPLFTVYFTVIIVTASLDTSTELLPDVYAILFCSAPSPCTKLYPFVFIASDASTDVNVIFVLS